MTLAAGVCPDPYRAELRFAQPSLGPMSRLGSVTLTEVAVVSRLLSNDSNQGFRGQSAGSLEVETWS